MLKLSLKLLKRECYLNAANSGEHLLVLMFFVITLSLFPLGVGASMEVLSRIGAGVIWVLALLSVLLSLERMFQDDFQDGSLEQIFLTGLPLELTALMKALAHWLFSGFPLVLVSPILAGLMGLTGKAFWSVPLSLILGTPVLTLIGSVCAALLLGSRRGTVLIAILALPLFIPVLIFGVQGIDLLQNGIETIFPFLLLGAMLLSAIVLAPIATAIAIRLALI